MVPTRPFLLPGKLTSIADSIRYKLETTSLMTVDEMPTNIEDIVTTHEIEDAIIDGSISGAYVNPRVTLIKNSKFLTCRDLTAVDFASVVTIGGLAFQNCTALAYVNVPVLTIVSSNTFEGCTSLTEIDLPSVEQIYKLSFNNCTNLAVLNLYSPSREEIPSLLNTSALTGTAIASGNGYIVINDEMVDELKQATNWSTYSDQIVGNSQAAQMGLIDGASATASTPEPLQTIPSRINADEINIERDPDLDLDLDLEPNERI